MTEDNRHELILDHLRALREGQARLENAVKDINAQLQAMRHNQISHSTESLRHDEKLAELETRLERLERTPDFDAHQ